MAPASAKGPRTPPETSRGRAQRRRWVTVLVWISLCATGWFVVRSQGGMIAGRPIDDLIPLEHRIPRDRTWILLTADSSQQDDRLLKAAQTLARRFAHDHIPLAPPEHERNAWNDEHALLLVPRSSHDELRDRLTDDSLNAAVDSLRAGLSSPFFGLLDHEVRRDPLRIRELAESFGHDPSRWRAAPTVTAQGDLLAADGGSLLMGLRTTRSFESVTADLREMSDEAVSATLVGPLARNEAQSQTLHHRWPALLWTTLAGLTLGWAVAYRRSGLVVAMLLTTFGCGIGLVALRHDFSLASGPLLPLLMAFVASFLVERSADHPRPSGEPSQIRSAWRKAVHVTAVAIALLPLAISPYPAWQQWSLVWGGAMAIAALASSAIIIPMVSALRETWRWPSRGFVLSPMPLTACLGAAAVLAGGAWASIYAPHRSTHDLPLSSQALNRAEGSMADNFFDPAQLAHVRSSGETPAVALERAAQAATWLHTLVPLDARRIDSPGDAVVPPERLRARQESLTTLNLERRMDSLARILESKGLRADAFGEFLRNTTDIEHPPTASAALDGPLGPWIEGYLSESNGRAQIQSTVNLVEDPNAKLTHVEVEGGPDVPLYGPIVADRLDRESFRDRLGFYSVATVGLGALCVGLGHASVIVALVGIAAAVVTQSAVLLVLALLGQGVGAHVLPPYLLLSVASMNASARAIHGADHDVSAVPGRELLIGFCLLVPGVALLASGEPFWREIGAVVATGAALSAGVGLFIAPGLCWMLRRLLRGVP